MCISAIHVATEAKAGRYRDWHCGTEARYYQNYTVTELENMFATEFDILDTDATDAFFVM